MELKEIINTIENDYYAWNIDSEFWQELSTLTKEDLKSDASYWNFVKVGLILSSGHGQYIPMQFYKNFDLKKWNVNPDEYKELEDPMNEYYWEAWNELIHNAHCIYDNTKYVLYQDSDLYAIHFKES